MLKGLLFLLMLLTSSCFAPQAYLAVARSPVEAFIHSSSIEVGGNETYVIANGSFVLNETIVVRENATLIIENAEVEFDMSSRTIIETYDNATVTIFNSTIRHVSGYSYIYFWDLCVSSIDASFFDRVYLYLYGNSTTSVNDSTFTYGIYADYYSIVSMAGCRVNYISGYGHSTVSLAGSIVDYEVYVYDYSTWLITDSEVLSRLYLEFEEDSEVSLVSLPTGSIAQWNLYENNTVSRAYFNLTISSSWVKDWGVYVRDTSVVSLESSTIDSLSASGFSAVLVIGSTVKYLYSYDSSNTSVIDSLISSKIYLEFEDDSDASLFLPTGYFSYWNLYADNVVAKAYFDLTLQNSDVNGWGTIYVRDLSVVSVADSAIGGLEAHDNTTIWLHDSTIGYLYFYQFSNTSVHNSVIDRLYAYDNSSVSILHCTVKYLYSYENSTVSLDSTVRYLYAYEYSTVSVSQSQVEYLGVYDHSTVSLDDCIIMYQIHLSFVSDSSVSITSLPTGSVGHWNLYENGAVTKAYINLTIQNSEVGGWGTISVYDTSVVSLENFAIVSLCAYESSTVLVIGSTVKYLYSYDSSSTSVVDSMVSGKIYLEFEQDSDVSLSLPVGYFSYWNLYADNVVAKAYFDLTLQNSDVNGWGTIYVRDFSVVSLEGSALDGLYAYDNTAISLFDSTVGYLYLYQFSNASVYNSVIDRLYAYDDSTVSLDSTVRYLYAYEYSTVSVSQSQVEYLGVYDHSTVSLDDCIIMYQIHLEFIGDSNVSLVLPLGSVSYWNLYENATVTKSYINLIIQNTKIRGWGTIYIYDSSVFSLTDSIVCSVYSYGSSSVELEDSLLEYVYAYDYSNVSMTDSIVSRTMYLSFRSDSDVSLTSLSPGKVKYWNLYENGTIEKAYVNHTIQNSWIGGWTIRAYDNSIVSITDSNLYYIYSYDASMVSLGNCAIEGSLYGYGESIVSVEDCSMEYVYVYDFSTWSIANSEVSSRLSLEFEEDSHVSLTRLPTGLVDQWNLYENGTVEKAYISLNVQNTSVGTWRLYVRRSSTLSLEDSTVDGLYAYDTSTISILDSMVKYTYAYDTSNVSILGSSVEYFYAYGSSTITVSSASSRSFVGYLYARDSCTVSITNSMVAFVYGYRDSTVQLVNCTSGIFHLYENSEVFVGWFLDVHVVDSIDQDVPSANVTATYPDATVAAWKLTDANGWARLTLIEKMMNATGSYPVGNYTVTATYEVHLGEESVNMTDNKQVTIALPFIIPEFPTFLLLTILMVVTLVSIAFQKHIQKKRKPFHIKTSTRRHCLLNSH